MEDMTKIKLSPSYTELFYHGAHFITFTHDGADYRISLTSRDASGFQHVLDKSPPTSGSVPLSPLMPSAAKAVEALTLGAVPAYDTQCNPAYVTAAVAAGVLIPV